MRSTLLVIATRNRHKTAEIRAILGVDGLSLEDFPDAPPLIEDAATFAGNAARKALQLAGWLAAARDQVVASPTEPRSRGPCPAPAAVKAGGQAHPGSGRSGALGEALPPAALAGRPCLVLADDSGLEVDALNGAPGVYSARFAALEAGVGANSSDAANNAKLLRLLVDVPPARRTARFRCVLALARVESSSSTAEPRRFEGVCEGRIRFAPSGSGGFGYDPLFVPDGFEQSFAELGEEVKNRISHRARALARLRAAWKECVAPV